MIAKHLSTNESVGAMALQTRTPGADLLDAMRRSPETRNLPATEGLGFSGVNGYQIALISLEPITAATPPGPAQKQNGSVPHLLLLPLTWDDLTKRIPPESIHPQLAGEQDIAQFGEVWIDFVRYEARRAGQPVQLTAIEFKILKFFVANPYRVISRDELLDKVWGYHCYPTTRVVDNKILSLRQKLERDPADPDHFQTVHGVGYKFVPVETGNG